MIVTAAAKSRIGCEIIGDDRSAGGDGCSEQRSEVWEFPTPSCIVGGKPPARSIPGGAGERMGLETGFARLIAADLTDNTVLALRNLEQRGKHLLAGALGIGSADIA